MDEETGETVPTPIRAAAALVALEAAALVALAGVVVYDIVVDTPDKLVRALFYPVGILALAAALVAGARSLLRLSQATRTPIVVVQLFALYIGWNAAFKSENPALGGPILLVALAVLYLLFTPPARAALDREPPR